MAYLKALLRCQGDKATTCEKPATVELVSVRNESYGKYCSRHGRSALSRLQKEEDERGTT